VQPAALLFVQRRGLRFFHIGLNVFVEQQAVAGEGEGGRGGVYLTHIVVAGGIALLERGPRITARQPLLLGLGEGDRLAASIAAIVWCRGREIPS
jgi:hypothetical protein